MTDKIPTQWFIGIAAPLGDNQIRVDYSDNLPLNDLPGILLEIAERITDGQVTLHPSKARNESLNRESPNQNP